MNPAYGNLPPVGETNRAPNPQWLAFKQTAPELVAEARHVAGTGLSYRDFKVGGAAIGFKNGSTEPVKFWGSNHTYERGDPRWCAEIHMLEDAVEVQNTFPDENLRLFGLVVSGPPQPDDVSRLESSTLHCCAGCRTELSLNTYDDYSVVDKDLVILCVHPSKNVFEIYTLEEMLHIHLQAQSKIHPEKAKAMLIEYDSLEEALEGFDARHPEITSLGQFDAGDLDGPARLGVGD